jgi:hypothetical protein
MRIERVGNCCLRYVRNDGTAYEIIGGKTHLDQRETEFRMIAADAATGPQAMVEPQSAPLVNMFDDPMYYTTPQAFPAAPQPASRPQPSYAGAAVVPYVEPLAMPTLNFDSPLERHGREGKSRREATAQSTTHNATSVPPGCVEPLAMPTLTF